MCIDAFVGDYKVFCNNLKKPITQLRNTQYTYTLSIAIYFFYSCITH